MIGTQLVKILVIDDHEVVRRGVKQILEEAFPQVEVGEADTGQEGDCCGSAGALGSRNRGYQPS